MLFYIDIAKRYVDSSLIIIITSLNLLKFSLFNVVFYKFIFIKIKNYDSTSDTKCIRYINVYAKTKVLCNDYKIQKTLMSLYDKFVLYVS